MKNFQWILACWLGLLSIAVIAMLVLHDITFDPESSAGVLISALGVLITFVVAWQIWQTIDAKEQLREARESINVVRALRNEVELLHIIPDAAINMMRAEDFMANNHLRLSFDTYIDALNVYIRDLNNHLRNTQLCLSMMLTVVRQVESSGVEADLFRADNANIAQTLSRIADTIRRADRLNGIIGALITQIQDSLNRINQQ